MNTYYDQNLQFPFDCWAPYGGFDMSEEVRRCTVTTVLLEYFELRDFLRANRRGVYAEFHRSLVTRRNEDLYPFSPVELELHDAHWDFRAEEEEVVPTISRNGHLVPTESYDGHLTCKPGI